MKNYKRLFSFLFSFILLLAVVVFAAAVQAQVNANTPPASDATTAIATGALNAVLGALTAKYGWVLTIITWIGVLRVVMKPIMLAVESIVEATPGTADDAAVTRFEQSAVYKWLLWGIDLVASVKTPTALKSGTTSPLIP